ncbi:hypothetical protein [Actinoplanes sp. GCM10030250]|uniref:DUF7507 domain-containing protein n=1 Tax=Actinoplanes sp. GCM10030250 TaxID=3273376 RepID=UPI00361140DC
MLRTRGTHRRRTSGLVKGVRAAVVAALVGTAGVAVPMLSTTASATQSACNNMVSLANGDFETPVIANGTVNIMPQASVPGWLTTATDAKIELWRGYNNTPSATGSQHAELNANQVSTLYQDLPTASNQVLRWELKHRGRTGVDTMSLQIGKPTGTLVQQGANMLDGNTAWGSYSGIYIVPAGQTTTRFAFKSIASANGDPTFGNFLDTISFGTAACLVTTTAVANGAGAATANPGDVLTYTVTARNDGGNPANVSSMADVLPAGTTYVPGSLKSVNGSTTVKPTDAAGDDTGEYDAAGRTVKVRVGTGASPATGGTLLPGESRTMSYQVRVNTAAAGTAIVHDAVSTYTDPLAGAARTSTSNEVSTTVNPAADLVVTAALSGSAVVAGSPVTYTVTGTNNGPSSASAVQLTGDVPSGLTGVTATSPGGTCTVGGTTAQCTYPSVATGTNRAMTITGTAPAAATPGAQYQLSAAVASPTFELNSVDNTTSLSNAVTTSADLAVTLTPPAAPVAGAMATYQAVVTNNGPSTARGITLANPVPTLDAGAPDPAATVTGGTCVYVTGARTLDCALPNLAPGATSTVTVRFQLPAGGAINNAVSIASSTPDPVIANNNASVSTAGTEIADVGVDLNITDATAKPGDLVDYTLTVTNHGPSVARNVSFNTVVPPGVTILRTPSSICTTSGCTIPALPPAPHPSSTVVITGKARIEAGAASGPGSTSTTVVSPTTDNVSANDTDTVHLTILLDAGLRVAETLTNLDHPGGAVAGERMREQITVANDGPTRAEGLVLRQSIPAGAIVPSVSAGAGHCDFLGTGAAGTITPDGGNFICTLSALADQSSWQITFTGHLPANFNGNTFSRTAVLTSSSPDSDSSDNSVTANTPVAHVADLALTQTTSTPQVIQSSPVQFQVTIRNDGPSDATGVIVREQPQSSLAISGGTPSTGTYDDAQRRWQIPVLAAGATATLTLSGVAQTAGTGSNTVQVLSADSTDPDSSNDTAVRTVTIDPSATSLAVTVTATVSPAAHQGAAEAGDAVSFAYLVRNTGNVTMSTIAVTAGLGGTVSCPQSSLAADDRMTCTSGTPYLIRQADIDAAQPVSDTVFASGFAPGATSASSFGPTLASVPVAAPAPAVTVVVDPVVAPAAHQNAAETGDTVTAHYRVTNTGNVTLTAVAVDGTRGGTATCPAGPLAAGAGTTCTGQPYQVTQGEVDAGQPLADTATATAHGPGSTTATGTGTSSVVLAGAAAALTVTVKPAVAPAVHQGAAEAGDTIGYEYVVTNSGNVSMNTIGVSGSLGGTLTCPATTLAVGASMTCVRTTAYPVTQAHIDAGSPITETAAPTGTTPTGVTSTFGTGSAAVAVAHAVPSLIVAVTPSVTPSSHQSAADVGDTITFRYSVTNNGNVTMTGVAVTDSAGAPVTCPATSLAIGATMTCTSTQVHTVLQSDIDGGQAIARTGSASGMAPGALGVTTSLPATGSVPLAIGAAALSVIVHPAVAPAAHQNAAAIGDVVTYTYAVTNNGNVTMVQVGVTGSHGGTASCPAAPLAVGAAVTCTGAQTYTITQADLDAGAPITESATAAGREPNAGGTTSFGPFTGVVSIAPATGQLNVVVTSTRSGPVAAGNTIGYQYAVTNTGNVTMNTITVGEASTGAAICPAGPLAVGASMTCTSTGTYLVTGADIDAQLPIAGSAYATGRIPGSAVARSFGPFTTGTAVAAAAPALNITITPSVAGPVAVGDSIDYQYVITNTGNVTMSAITVDAGLGGTVMCPQTSLAAAGSATCTAAQPHVVTQEDVDAGRPVEETAWATGRAPGAPGGTTFGPVTADVPVVATGPALTVAVEAVVAPAAHQDAAEHGDTVAYRYLVTNTGNVSMRTVGVTDSAGAAVTCPTGVLRVGATVTCTSTLAHEVGQSDVDAGQRISRSATAEAYAPGAVLPTASPVASGGTGVVAAAERLSLAVTASIPGGLRAGDQLGYSYRVINTGNVTMSGVGVQDSRTGAASCPVTVLAVGVSVTCVSGGAYRVTPADVDAAAPLTGTATAAGRKPGVVTATTFAPVTTSVTVAAAAPELTVTVHPVVGPASHQGAAEAGDTISYEYVVTNTGNVTMTGVGVGDARVGAANCPVTTLAAGASVTCVSPTGYRVSAADVESGELIRNDAHAQGRPAGSSTPERFGPFSAAVAVVQGSPSLTVLIFPVVSPAEHQNAVQAGDRVSYRYLVTNNGTRPMNDIVVNDTTGASLVSAASRKIKTAAPAVDCPATTLGVGDSMNCTSVGSRPVTQADIDAGLALPRSATVTGVPTGGSAPQTYGPTRTDTPVVAAAPDLAVKVNPLVTPAAHRNAAVVGDRVTYEYVVTNDGNVTMRSVAVADAFGGDVECPATTLAVGASMTCTATRTYLVTQADLDAGLALQRTAAATGVRPGATAPASFAPHSASVPLTPPAPKLTAEQNAVWQDMDGDGILGPADVITSTLVVVNTGNVTVRALTVAGLPADVTCSPTVLAPGERATCVSLPYHLTAAQIAEGVHRNEATVTGSTQAGPQVQGRAPATIVAPAPTSSATATGTPTSTRSATATPTSTATGAPTSAPSAPTGGPSTPTADPTFSVTPAPSDTATSTPGPGGSDGASPLPTTGSNIAGMVLGGAGLLAAGMVLLLLTRRRSGGAHRRA